VHPQKFSFVENPGKISENLHKTPENMSKNGAQINMRSFFIVYFGQKSFGPSKICFPLHLRQTQLRKLFFSFHQYMRYLKRGKVKKTCC